MFLSALCRIALYVEDIFSESAKRLQLSTSEEIKNETFSSNGIVFGEIKVCCSSESLSKTVHELHPQAMRQYLLQNGVRYSLSTTNQGLFYQLPMF